MSRAPVLLSTGIIGSQNPGSQRRPCPCLPGCQLQLACRLAPRGLQSLPQKQPTARSPGKQLLAASETQCSQLKPPCRGVAGSSLCFPSLGLTWWKILGPRISKVLNAQIASAALFPWRCTSKQICLFCEFFQQHWSGLLAARCLCFKLPVTDFLPEVRAGVGQPAVWRLYWSKFYPWNSAYCVGSSFMRHTEWSSALGVVVVFYTHSILVFLLKVVGWRVKKILFWSITNAKKSAHILHVWPGGFHKVGAHSAPRSR